MTVKKLFQLKVSSVMFESLSFLCILGAVPLCFTRVQFILGAGGILIILHFSECGL